MRTILTHAVATLITVFLLVLISATSALAVTSASWNGSSIVFDGNTHEQKTADGTTPPSLDNNQVYFVSSEVTNVLDGSGTNSVIYFEDGVTMSKAVSAIQAVYEVSGSGTYGRLISGPTTIPLVPKERAPSSVQAGWTGDNLQYDGKTFEGNGSGPWTSTSGSPPSLPANSQYYEHRSTPGFDGSGILSVIYFPAGVDVKTATTASFATYRIDGSGNIGNRVGNVQTIDVVPLTVANSDATGSTSADGSSCGVESIGWIVCPLTNFLAWGMDRIFDMLRSFLEVQPISTDTESGLYQAWNLIRSFANIAFVIAFLIIIYSQLTNIGLTSYSMKKLLPRLILSAIAVNLSYFICAIAVDLSNVAGVGLQQILLAMRESLDGPNSNSIASWESVTGYILTAGTATGAAAVAIGGITIASGASLGAALILLLPMLLGLIIAVLVALVVLATRQALIVILIIIAPLAFVAYLLPNTEKWFEKWRSLFTTMLVFFPLFALVFGGSQLAGYLIIQTATEINVILLAMFVQVAPLVITPLLVRLSGGLVGRIAGLINDPKRGFIDRTRNWSKQQSDLLASRNMARRDPVRRRQVFRRFALGADQVNRSREERMAAYKEASNARWTNSQSYSDIQQTLLLAQDEKAIGAETATARYESSRTTNGDVRNADLRLREAKLRTENAKLEADVQWDGIHSPDVAEQRMRSRILKDQKHALESTHDAEYEEFKYGRVNGLPRSAMVNSMLLQSRQDTEMLAVNAMRTESAKRAVTERFTKDIEESTRMINGQSLQYYAGGVQGSEGAYRALAAALSAQAKAQNEAIANATAILDHRNFDDALTTEIALGNSSAVNITITDDMQLAAIRKIAGGGNTDEIIRLMRDIEISPDASNVDIRQTFYDALMSNSAKPKFAGAGIMAAIKQGFAPASGKERLDKFNAETINANKFASAEVLVTQDRSYLETLYATLQNNLSTTPIDPVAKAALRRAIIMAETTPQYSGKIGERKDVLNRIKSIL